MAEVTITFHERGQEPISYILSAVIAGKMDRYVADEVVVNPETGEVTQKYAGKAELFLRHNLETLITPIDRRYPDADPPEVIALRQQIAQAQAQLTALKAAAYLRPAE